MSRRPLIAASLAGAVIALAPPPTAEAAQTSAGHASGSTWFQDWDGHGEGRGEGHGDDRDRWRDCHSAQRVILIDAKYRVILKNGPKGPEALVIENASSEKSPSEPWDDFFVTSYLDVNYPSQTSNQYQWKIRDFFWEHPLFEVKAFDDHRREFPFPATHCIDDRDGGRDGGGRGGHGHPSDGETTDASDPSGSPSPQGKEHDQDAQPTPSSTGSHHPLPLGAAGEGRRDRTLSAKHIGFVGGGLLLVLGTLATTWARRRRH
ncbi:hypothetical protein [Streptomyces sp. FH025]|uniref:hypothetical protein n=1 Tax=Streptomyces sp. FH025 TaxID=2815937 RepID=UPI001A9CBA8C|nr:hypothetical protein [Streptomyces sp. FH025]MBO1420357.1 hypothetical protein [Streptomyces sp. FH025]